MASVSETLQVALGHHQAGRLEQAESLYRDVLRVDPAQPYGLHLLGLACQQQGRHEAAVGYFDQAVPLRGQDADVYCDRAVTYFALGRVDEAMADCRRALEIDPGRVSAQNNLAHALNEKSRFDQAERWCREAIRRDPEFAGAHVNLGRALRGQDRLDEALAAYHRAVELDPQDAETHNNLGNLYQQTKQFKQAAAAYRKTLAIQPGHEQAMNSFSRLTAAALAVKPDNANALSKLGKLFSRQQKFQDAEAIYRKVLAVDPDHVETLSDLSHLLIKQRNFQDAEAACRRALTVEPDNVEIHVQLGHALDLQERSDEALACFQHALLLDPKNVTALAGLAMFHEKANDLETAEKYAVEGLELAPAHPKLNLALGICDIRKGRFEQAVDRLKGIGGARLDVLFELGGVYDRLGRFEEAFAAWKEANQQASREVDGLGFNKTTTIEEIAHLRAAFQPEWIESWTEAPPLENEKAPAFMTGFPRSGTTLLDQILDSHPAIQTLEEKPTMDEVQAAFDSIGGSALWTVASLQPEHFDLLRGAYFRAVDRYLDRKPELLLVDRNPFLTGVLGMVHRVFPSAKIILVVRHPCDVCLSCYTKLFQLHEGTSYFYNLQDTARLYAETMDIWRHFSRVLRLDYQVVRYEDLLDDFEGQTRRLLDFLEVGWDDNVRNHAQHARGRRIHTASYQQVVQPLYRRSRYRWRHYAKQLAPVMDTLQPYIEHFGYDREK